ncbi:hypothetical protein CerSpe_293950 [Prunus speciosa]
MDSDEAGVVDYEFIDNDSDDSNDVASHRYQVYVIGEEGILKELELAGYQYIGGQLSLISVYVMEGIGHSVYGKTLDVFSLQQIMMLSLISKMLMNGQVDRGGSLVGAIRGSTQREPLVVGKPSTFMMGYLANDNHLDYVPCLKS